MIFEEKKSKERQRLKNAHRYIYTAQAWFSDIRILPNISDDSECFLA